MARVLVTGGAGFIGSHLVDALVTRGDQVRVLDNFSTGSRANLDAVAQHIELHEGDLRNPRDLARALDGIELLLHQAAFVSVPESIENPSKCFAVNVQGVIDLLAAARAAGVGRVVLASSAAVYGARQQLPLNEEQPPEILSPYAASKLFNESLAQLYTHSLDLPVVALRYFNVYGPRQSPHSDYAAVIPRFIARLQQGNPPQIYGDGTQSRDFIYVADVVRANFLAADAPAAPGLSFNICSGQETSLLDLLESLKSLYHDAPEPEFSAPRVGDIPRSMGDPALAARDLNFEAQVSLSEGLHRSVEVLAA